MDELRRLVLEHFEKPNFSARMHTHPRFEGYDYGEVRHVRLGLIAAGLLKRVRGQTRGTVWELSDHGERMLDELRSPEF
jgi:hypothetical protein